MNDTELFPASALLAPHYPVAVFTACSANYLTKALAMCLSVLEQHPSGIDVLILLVDRKRPVKLDHTRVRLMWAEDVGFPDLQKCAFKYNIIELNTALKPFAALKLLGQYGKVIYLDPDVCVFSPLSCVIDALDEASTVVSPHAMSPYEGAGRPTDQDLLRFGAYNLGFFAVSDTIHARALLNWWHKQCSALCFYEPQNGLGVDQKWIDLAPAFFEGVRIHKDPGINVAFWNLHERNLSRTENGWWVNSDARLVFVHFSSFVEADPSAVADKQTRYSPGSRPDFAQAAQVYRGWLHAAHGLAELETSYGFGSFRNGRPVSPMLRRMYAVYEAESFSACDDPFAADGPVYAFAERHGLLSRLSASTVHQNFKVAAAYGKERRAISMLFRLGLRLLGPDRYFALMRFISHYSSTLNQVDLLKN